ncbi:MAG: hypothetical protein LC657_10895 [Desulfobacteraceae bacterium]|nr:hypothetical protein [Desulfobacteraceae bacterium]
MIVHAGNLIHGDYGFIDQVMGSYRIHKGGMASGSSRIDNVKATLAVYRLMGQYYGLADRPSFRQGVHALRFSRTIEQLMKIILPDTLKNRFDRDYGVKLRAIIRKVFF